MSPSYQTFAQTIQRFEHYFDLRTVFDDFLTLTLCSFSQNTCTGKSYDEDLYLETIAKYKNNNLVSEFPKLLAYLTLEMETRLGSDSGNDVLGEFYELQFNRRGMGQYFTPWPICSFIAKSTAGRTQETNCNRPLNVLDPTCGSGRMILACARENGPQHCYYGIDIDYTCVKMTTLNLFLNGLFHCEVMWADALSSNDFRGSYITSFLPFGVFRIKEKEQSMLWHMVQNRQKLHQQDEAPNFSDTKYPTGNQLTFF